MNTLFYCSLERIPLGLAVALEFTGPLGVALWHSHRRIHLVWVALAALGIYLILPVGTRIGTADVWGVIYALGAGLCWGLYIIFGQRLGRQLPSAFASSLGVTVAALVVLPWGLSAPLEGLSNLSVWMQALLLAVLSSALPYSLEMIALKRLPTHTFGILMSLEPALAALMGYLFLLERLTPLQWLAIAAIMLASLGSAISQRDESPANRTSTPDPV
jgi:inner membrane transporter RhtA